MSKVIDAILDAVYPKNVVCAICSEEAHTDKHGLCAECAALLVPAGIIEPLGFVDEAYCAVKYDEHIARAVHNYKYNDARYLCSFFASLIDIPKPWVIDAVVPVPLHRAKQNKRGYNQSALIAYKLSERYGLPVREDLLERIRNTSSQRLLNAEEREKNTLDAFRASDRAKDKRILLIDDVFTTGATMNECAKALKLAGAAYVYAAAPCIAGKEHFNKV